MKDAMTQTAAATAFTTEQPPLSAPEPEQGNSDNGGDNSGQVQDDIRQIIETGSITVDKNGHYIHCLTIIGQIEGHYILPPQNKTTKYEHVIPQLVAIEESKEIEGLLIILNTVGGDIEAGLAIAELIARDEKADRFACARRRPFYRRAAGCFRQTIFYCALSNDDHSSRAHERACHRRAADALLF